MTPHYNQAEFRVQPGEYFPSVQELIEIADLRDEISNFFKIYSSDRLIIINDPEDDIII